MSASKILVVTGDDGFGECIRACIRESAEVKVVGTREEALDCSILGCPDLVLLDHDSAPFDCLDLIAITGALRCRFACAIATSRPSEGLARDAARQGITHVLVKPVNAAALEELLRPEFVPGVPAHQQRGGFASARA